nr:MAG TPA: hypothetical protein [Caudoviricetes sp.]
MSTTTKINVDFAKLSDILRITKQKRSEKQECFVIRLLM